MTHDLADLLDVLDLRCRAPGRYRGRSSALPLPRVFGGQVAAQAVVAAGRTAPEDRPPHSLHGYFLRPGDPTRPIDFTVHELRDGRTVSTRTVDATQDGRRIFHMAASFTAAGTGVSHQPRPPDAGPPESQPTLAETLDGGLAEPWLGFEAVEMRLVPRAAGSPHQPPDPAASRDLLYLRATGELPDDPLLHAAVLCYATDLTLLAAALVPHGVVLGRERHAGLTWDTVSLDHSLWLHRPARADRWLLFDQCSPVSVDGRALSTARIFDGAGALVASVSQEGLLRATG